MSGMSRVVLAVAVVALPNGQVAAQPRVNGQVRGLLSTAGVERSQTGTTTQLDGTVIGVDGAVRFGILELGGRYLQGGIEQENGSTTQDMVDGELQLRVRPLRYVSLGIGPHARSYVESGTERWLVWEARAAGEMWLMRDVLRTWLGLRLGLGGSVNSGEAFGSGRGVEGGLEFRFPRTPIFVGVTYSVDQLSLADDSRTDTVEQLGVRVGLWP